MNSMNIESLIKSASSHVGVSWPLDRSVAVNPLLDSYDKPFFVALTELERQLGEHLWPTVVHTTEAVKRGFNLPSFDSQKSSTPKLRPGTYFERGGEDIRAAQRVRALVGQLMLEATTMENSANLDLISRAVHVLCSYTSWSGTSHKVHRELADLLVNKNLDELISGFGGWSEEQIVEEFRRHFARLPGWAAWAKWNDEWARDTHKAKISRAQFLTISLAADLVASSTTGAAPEVSAREQSKEGAARLVALENATYSKILQSLKIESVADAIPLLQVVTCIDVRSEPLRRALEVDPRVATFGFAGFFGVPAEITALGEAESYEALPVLVTPSLKVEALGAQFAPRDLELRVSELFADLTHEPQAMFALAEGAGWFGLPWIAYKKIRGLATPLPQTSPITVWQLDTENKADIAMGALQGMGLTKNFARFVAFLGHASRTSANPHYATLDCGACAGHPGGSSAQILADILNETGVRGELLLRGIEIPLTTTFLAGEHNTTTESVVMYSENASEVRELVQIFKGASDLLAQERDEKQRSISRSRRTLLRKSRDWAETRPEWGLANHVSFVIADRRTIRGANLGGQSFLHSYDVESDGDGAILRSILAAPVVVAHWINMSYYFSTVAPDLLGAGDKSVLNPVGDFAVIAGDDPDLRLGLPWQSVAAPTAPYHLPVRLMVVVQAPLDRIAGAIAAEPLVTQLVEGQWIRLVARADEADQWHEWVPAQGWSDTLYYH